MPKRSPLEQTLRRFAGAGVPPALCATRALDPSRPITSLFDEALQELNATELPALPGSWRALTLQEATVLLAVRRHRTQAYDDTRGDPANHLRAAHELLTAMDAQRAWANSDTVQVVNPLTLRFPEGGYGVGYGFGVGLATFEELVLVEGRTHALLALWTDED